MGKHNHTGLEQNYRIRKDSNDRQYTDSQRNDEEGLVPLGLAHQARHHEAEKTGVLEEVCIESRGEDILRFLRSPLQYTQKG
jgi:hypothetical protein